MRSRRKRRRVSRYLIERQQWKLSLLREFVARHGWAKLKPGTVVAPGVHLHRWVTHRRSDYRADRIPHWLVTECEQVPGWSWSIFLDAHRRNVDNLRVFVKTHGWEALAARPIVDRVRLDKWVAHRREEYKLRTLDKWLIRALEAIPGWTWDPRRAGYEHNLRELRDHVAKHGWSAVHEHSVSENGIKIGHWTGAVRAKHRRGELEKWVEAELERIPGWTWDPNHARQQQNIERLAAFVRKDGWNAVTDALVIDGIKLGDWICNARMRYRRGSLSAETVAGLEAIPGWSWTGRRIRNEHKDASGRFTTKPRARRV